MPSVAVNPQDPRHVVIAYMDYSRPKTDYAGISVAVSHDGGSSWDHSAIPLPGPFNEGAANPVVKFDNVDHDPTTPGVQNRVYVSFMAATFLGDVKPPITNPTGATPSGALVRAQGFQSNNGIFVASSDDGLTWHRPVAVTSHRYKNGQEVPFEINPDLAIDTFPTLADGKRNPNFGHIYVTWARYYPSGQYPGEPGASGGSQVMIAVSNDGQKWVEQLEERPDSHTFETVIVDAYDSGNARPGSGAANNPHVAVGPQGDVYVSIFERNTYYLYHSANGGQSFVAPDPNPDSLRGLPFDNKAVSPTPPGIPSLDFRLLVSRGIAADPTKAGRIFAAEAYDLDVESTVYDVADIVFARSEDHGGGWQSTFKLGENNNASFINDDNGGQRARLDHLDEDITGGQVMPRLAIDSQGNLALIWYDTRRDPDNLLFDVFASVSTDHGKTFSPNFRITDTSFDPNLGRFDAAGAENFSYFGDSIGLSMANNELYAAWTDTRNGNQDIVFSRIGFSPVPDPPNDRFEANNDKQSATQLGSLVTQTLSRLAISAGDEDWFQFTSLATGQLKLSVLSNDAARLQVELRDLAGNDTLSVVTELRDAAGTLIGKQITVPGSTSQSYLVHVSSSEVAASTKIAYELKIESLTGKLGQIVYRNVEGSLGSGDQAYYLVESAAVGTMRARLTLAADFDGEATVEFLDSRTFAVLAAGTSETQLEVSKGQSLLVHVGGGTGHFRLELTNFDQFSLANRDTSTLFFPAGKGPSEVAIGLLNEDAIPDLVVSSAQSNVVNVLIGNGDGTFQAPRQFAVGAFKPVEAKGTLVGRAVAVADFNGDLKNDIVVTNLASSDVSLLLGRGDGTFDPQRRFDATAAPFAMAVGKINDDEYPDLVVVDSLVSGKGKVGILLNRGDGTFLPAKLLDSPLTDDVPLARVKIADVDNDSRSDLVIASDFDSFTRILLQNSDGTFRRGEDFVSFGPGIAIADLNHDDFVDIVHAQYAALNKASFALNNGDGTFNGAVASTVGASPIAIAVTDFDGDTILDLIVANSGQTQPLYSGPPTIMLLRGLETDAGDFDGFDDAIVLATLKYPHDLQTADLDHDGRPEIVVVDRDGIVVIFNEPPKITPNNTPLAARDLGDVVHLVQPTLTIVPGQSDAYYKLTVPSEAFTGADSQVLDFSGGFANEFGPGLMMEVRDSAGNLLGSGERFRIVADQGEPLLVHIFGEADNSGAGAGAYTLAINALPQVADVEAHSLLPAMSDKPAGPTTSLVLVFQGDRLDAAAAENAQNYTITWFGPDGIRGTSDDRHISVGIGLAAGAKSAIYDASSNVEPSSGRRYPTAVRQTVTLLFGQPLPEGSYEIIVSANVVSAPFNAEESQLITQREGFGQHPVVSVSAFGAIHEGARLLPEDLVRRATGAIDLEAFERGTRAWTQFHNDLSATLDSLLTQISDDLVVTDALLAQIEARIIAALGPMGQQLASIGLLLLDPVSIGLVAPDGNTFTYDLQGNTFDNTLRGTFVEVSRNVELVVILNPRGVYQLDVANVPSRARGGMVYLNNSTHVAQSFTQALQSGVTKFEIPFTSAVVASGGLTAAILAASQHGSAPPPPTSPRFGIAAPTTDIAARTRTLAELAARSGSPNARAIPRADSDGSGSAPNTWRDLMQQAWDELSGLWDDSDTESEAARDEAKSNAKSASKSAILRVWHVMTDFVDQLLGDAEPDESNSPSARNEREAAQQDATPSNSDTGDHAPEARQINVGREGAAPANGVNPDDASISQVESGAATDSPGQLPNADHPTHDPSPRQRPSAATGAKNGNQPHASAA
jgi:hypothetical protein